MLKKEQQHWITQLKSYKYETPFTITDLEKVKDNAKMLTKLMPSIEFYYAVKSCDDPQVINAVKGLVKGYDIASQGEFELTQSLGINPEHLLYSNPVKIPSHINKTYKGGVRYFAFDSLDEIKKLKANAPDAKVYLRVKVSDYGSKFPLSSKFGVDPLHALAYMDMAREAGLNAVGLSFHVGSQSENPHTWISAFETCGGIIKRLENAGIKIEFINIGGGFPVTYTERIASIKQIAATINKGIAAHIPKHVKIIAEPGRFISANASVIVSSVIAREHRGSNEWLFLDMGVFQGLIEPLEMSGWRYPIFTDYGRKANAFSQLFTLTGPTCDAYDTIGLDYALPSTIKTGDKVYIGNTGAYTSVYASQFNGFKPPKTYYISNKS